MKARILKSFILLSILSSNSLLAHEGHGVLESSPLHYIYSYSHLVILLLAIIGVYAVFKIFKRAKKHS